MKIEAPSSSLRIGDIVTAPTRWPRNDRYEGVIAEFDRYGQIGTVCVYLDWDGDCVYVDYKSEDLQPQDPTKASMWARRVSVLFRREAYAKNNKEECVGG